MQKEYINKFTESRKLQRKNMATGKVLTLYMTLPDMLRSGYRQTCDNFECDPLGIQGDINYEVEGKNHILLVSQKSYELINNADIHLDKGILLENIYVDIDLYHLKEGDIIEIGDTLFKVDRHCETYGYLYTYAPEVPELIHGNRGLFVTPLEYGSIEVGSEVTVIESK